MKVLIVVFVLFVGNFVVVYEYIGLGDVVKCIWGFEKDVVNSLYIGFVLRDFN